MRQLRRHLPGPARWPYTVTMATSTTTSIQLTSLSQRDIQHRDIRQQEAYTEDLSDSDPVLEASRIADRSVPDGGFAWVVISACAVLFFWITGCSYSWGVLQNALADQGLASAATLSFIGSISPTIMAGLAIPNAGLIRWLGIRQTSIIGISFVVLSLITSSFCVHSVVGQFITRGALLGIGMSLCFMATSVTPTQYFWRKRGIANGIVSAGGGLGGAVVSYALDALIQRYGVAWAYRIMGIAALVTGLPAAWFVRERAPVKTASFIEWRLFKDAKFVLMFTSGAVATFPLLVPAFFLPLYSNSIGLSSTAGAALLAGFNFSSAIGRILGGVFADKLGPLNSLFTSLMLSAVTMLALWPASTTIVPLAAFSVVNGASNGMYFAIMPTVVGNIFGSARVSVALGMMVTGWGPGYLMVSI